MTTLTEKQADLFRGKNWATVVTLRTDGSPHATPVWIDTDGEHVLFNTAVGRAQERERRPLQHRRRPPEGAPPPPRPAGVGDGAPRREPAGRLRVGERDGRDRRGR